MLESVPTDTGRDSSVRMEPFVRHVRFQMDATREHRRTYVEATGKAQPRGVLSAFFFVVRVWWSHILGQARE